MSKISEQDGEIDQKFKELSERAINERQYSRNKDEKEEFNEFKRNLSGPIVKLKKDLMIESLNSKQIPK